MTRTLFAIPLLFSISVNATLIDRGSYVQDTASGLEWLKLEATIGLSSGQVVDQLGLDGTFDGWQYATSIQWEHLLFGQGFGGRSCAAGNFCGSVDNIGGSEGYALMNLIGYVSDFYTSYPYYNSLGMLADIDTLSGKRWITQLFTDEVNDVLTTFAQTFHAIEINTEEYRGSWLVRVTEVPEPSTLYLPALSLAGLWSARRKLNKS